MTFDSPCLRFQLRHATQPIGGVGVLSGEGFDDAAVYGEGGAGCGGGVGGEEDYGVAYVTPGALVIAIDIYPGRSPNPIRLDRNYTIYVGVLHTEDFDPADLEWSTVRFGPTGVEASPVRRPSTRDLNRDGLPDLLLGFRTFDCGFELGDEVGILTGTLHDGTPVEGQDSVVVTP